MPNRLKIKTHEARYTHSETAFRLRKDPDSPIPPYKITAYAFLGTDT